MLVTHVDQLAFQRLLKSPLLNTLDQTEHNSIGEECCVARCAFGHIKKIVNSLNRLKDGCPTLFHANFLLDALRKLITRRCPDRITGIIEEEPQLVPGDNPLRAARLLFHQCPQKGLRM
jgi:hypothetical protein